MPKEVIVIDKENHIKVMTTKEVRIKKLQEQVDYLTKANNQLHDSLEIINNAAKESMAKVLKMTELLEMKKCGQCRMIETEQDFYLCTNHMTEYLEDLIRI